MPLIPGSRLGPYEILSPLGAGGMGEVYRATDTSLKRSVAIKVLPDSVAGDAERLARFQREAEVLASLNHPNIASICGLEKSDGTTALVMELVEGPTLADRIAHGPIPIDEAFLIAKQIAEGLEVAHERGIIHRDLKPANIKVRPDGAIKILDFGLAKAFTTDTAMASSTALTNSPTLTSPIGRTEVGIILGTAAYMAPEQAKGRSVDARADVWAFGVVFFEMLSGRRAFDGQDTTEILGAVVRLEPDWKALPSATPPHVGQLIRACLQKPLKQRIAHMQDVRLALDGAFETRMSSAVDSVMTRQATVWQRVVTVGAAVVSAAIVAGTAVWFAMRPAPPAVIRTEVPTAGAVVLSTVGTDRDVAITPDGSRIVYRGENQLLVRALNQLTPTAHTGLGQPRGIFISPDGQSVGFFDGVDFRIRKVAITGGPPVNVTTGAALSGVGAPRGATWGDDGTIIYATSSRGTGLRQVAAAGGEATVVTTPDLVRGEVNHWWPEFVPGGQAVLFTIMSASGGLDTAQIAVLDLRTRTQTILVSGGHHAHYVPSGHLVYGSGGTLRAVAFDRARLTVSGTPVPVVENVFTTSNGGLDAVVAANGTLVYVRGGLVSTARVLVWVDRQGREEPIQVPSGAFVYAQLSPDGAKIALDLRDQQQDIWMWDLVRGPLQRLTFDPDLNRTPLWTRNGQRLAFSRTLDNTEEIYWQSADGSGVPEPLTQGSKTAMSPSDFSPDGMLLYHPSSPLSTSG